MLRIQAYVKPAAVLTMVAGCVAAVWFVTYLLMERYQSNQIYGPVIVLLPDSFGGVLEIRTNESDGTPTAVNGPVYLRVGDDGTVKVAGNDPATEWHSAWHARRESGEVVPVSITDPNIPAHAIALRPVRSTLEEPSAYFIVGTALEAEEAALRLQATFSGGE